MPESPLIDSFLWNVRRGFILGKDDKLRADGPDTSGPGALDAMTKALSSILDGMPPDEALRIVRRDGKPRDPLLDHVCRVVHNNRKRKTKTKWSVIHLMVNEYYEKIGRQPVTERAIRDAYKLRKPDLEQQDDIHRFFQEIEEFKKLEAKS